MLNRAVRAAHGHRVYVVSPGAILIHTGEVERVTNPLTKALLNEVRGPLEAAGYRMVESRVYPGVVDLSVSVFARRA